MARILVVDDDTAVQATVRLLLERAGHSVVTAGDGQKGIALFEAGDFDLLFLDIFMPGMDGFETMRLVHQRKPRIPIIVISGKPIPLGFRPGLPHHGDQARGNLEPAEAVQTRRPAGSRHGMSGTRGPFIGRRPTRERCCFRPVMRNSIRFDRPARRAEWEGVRTPR